MRIPLAKLLNDDGRGHFAALVTDLAPTAESEL